MKVTEVTCFKVKLLQDHGLHCALNMLFLPSVFSVRRFSVEAIINLVKATPSFNLLLW